VIALAAVAVVLLAAARMRHARKVFDDIADLNRPVQLTPPVTADDLARARARHARPEPDRHRKHG
jgi:hypothetical protein